MSLTEVLRLIIVGFETNNEYQHDAALGLLRDLLIEVEERGL